MYRLLSCVFLAVVLSASVANAADDEWGMLRMRFVYDGEPPTPPQFVNKFGAPLGLDDESLLVHSDSRGLANVVVFLVVDALTPVQVHPDLERPVNKEVEFVTRAPGRFDPHFLLMRTDQTLVIRNADVVGYNSKIEFLKNPPINPIIPARSSVEFAVREEERLPIEIADSIHRWMTGRILVRSNPYMAVSDKNGVVEIKKLPRGELRFTMWHEKSGYLQDRKPDPPADGPFSFERKGQLRVRLDAEQLDLGEIKVTPAQFRPR